MRSRTPPPRISRLRILLAAACALLLGPTCPYSVYPDYITIHILPGEDFPQRLRENLVNARPGTVFELPEGSWEFETGLTLSTSHVTLRGRGMRSTVLSFRNQTSGAQGLLVTGDQFAMENIGIEDPPGDGVKTEGIDGVTFRHVRVEWTDGPDSENGPYGIYPVRSRNILVENCFVRGASDTGIYVGQSENIVVRYNQVTQNVAGIEIENSSHADVYQNYSHSNTGGILVFDLPGLDVQGGGTNRVWGNWVLGNNTTNFAPPQSILGQVPKGTGMLVMANDDVEVFYNVFDKNQTVGIAIISYFVTFEDPNDPSYDPYPERIFLHDNVYTDNGGNPQGPIGAAFAGFFEETPQIGWDGWKNPELVDGEGELPPALKICIREHGTPFGNLNELQFGTSDLTPHACRHEPVVPASLAGPTPIPEPAEEYSEEEIAALCNAAGEGVNWDAFVVNCPKLSDYRLFEGGDPRVPGPEGVPFDLTTPLFSDYAQKYRILYLPPGTQATYRETQSFDFPVGTIIAKTFSFAHDLRDLGAGEDLVETRLLVHREHGWRGIPFIWNEEESEAFLSRVGGSAEVSWIHTDGSMRQTTYQIPDVNQCTECHGDFGGDSPIGPKARLLNRDYPYEGGAENQLVHWNALGILSGAPATPAEAPRLPFWNDPGDGTLEERARAYLETNCAHCHNPMGQGNTSGLFLDADRTLDIRYGLCKPPVAAGRGAGDLSFDVVPGQPEESILLFRMDSAEPGIAMPELAKSVVHDEGVSLVEAWIASLPGSCE